MSPPTDDAVKGIDPLQLAVKFMLPVSPVPLCANCVLTPQPKAGSVAPLQVPTRLWPTETGALGAETVFFPSLMLNATSNEPVRV